MSLLRRVALLLLAVSWPTGALRAASELKADLAEALAQAEAALLRGEVASALAISSRAVVAHPRNPQLWTLRASAHLARRDWDAAIADCTMALQIDPAAVVALNHRGGAYLARQDLPLALQDFEAVLVADPQNSIAFTYRAQIRRVRGDFFRALEDAHEAIRHDSNNAAAYTERAAIRAALGDIAAGIEDCSSALTIGGLHEQALHLRAMLYMQQADYPRARTDFDELLASGSDFSDLARVQLAWLLATAPLPGVRDGARASRLAHEAVARAGHPDPAALDALAAAAAELGDFTGALAAAHRALAATPETQPKQRAAREARARQYLAGQPFRLPNP